MMSDVNGYAGFRLRQPEVYRQRTARQLWQTLDVAFPGVFTHERPRRGESDEETVKQENDVQSQYASYLSLLGRPAAPSLVAFVGQAVLGDGVPAVDEFGSDNASESKQSFELRFLADCDENSPRYWEMSLYLSVGDDDKVRDTNKICLVDSSNQPLSDVDLLVVNDSSHKVVWKKHVGTGSTTLSLTDLKSVYMQSPAVSFPDGSIQGGKLASVSPVS